MIKKTLGKFIYEMREKQNISQNELCDGLCSVQLMSNIEHDISVPNIYLFDCLIQRLGVSPDKFETILSDEEFHLIRTREKIEYLLEAERLEEAEKLLKQYIDEFKEEGTLHFQYYYKIKAIIKSEKGNQSESIRLLKKSLECTVRNRSGEETPKVRWCVNEIEILLLLAQEYKSVDKGDYAKQILLFLLSYLEENYNDDEELVRIYPKVVYLLVASEKSMKFLRPCEKAFSLLVEQGSLVFLPEIMEALLEHYYALNLCKKATRIKKQLKALQEVAGMVNMEIYMSRTKLGICKKSRRREYFLLSEVVRGERLLKGMTQERLVEGIYENVESLARIERGTRSPSRKKFDELMLRLGLEKQKYSSHLLTEDYRLLESEKRIAGFMNRHEYENAKIELEELRKNLNTESITNRQYLANRDAYFLYEFDMINSKEFYKKLLDALSITYPYDDKKMYRVPTHEEAMIFNLLILALQEDSNSEKAIMMMEAIVDCYKKSKIGIEYHYRSFSTLYSNYMILLEVVGWLKEAETVCIENLKYNFLCMRGEGIDVVMSQLACVYEKFNLSEEEKKKALTNYLRQAYYLADLFLRKETAELYDVFYRKNIDREVIWY